METEKKDSQKPRQTDVKRQRMVALKERPQRDRKRVTRGR